MAGKLQNLAVLVDGDNVPAARVDDILRMAGSLGRIAVRRVYTDWSNPHYATWKDACLANGFEACQATVAVSGKNTSDIALIIDAMDLFHENRFDGFVIVSSDSDFTALAHRVRRAAVPIFGIGRANASTALQAAFDRFIPFAPPVVELTPASEVPQKCRTTAPRHRNAVGPILAAMKRVSKGNGWVPLSQLGNSLKTGNTAFSSKQYGCKNLRDLLEKNAEFELMDSGGVWRVRRVAS